MHGLDFSNISEICSWWFNVSDILSQVTNMFFEMNIIVTISIGSKIDFLRKKIKVPLFSPNENLKMPVLK